MVITVTSFLGTNQLQAQISFKVRCKAINNSKSKKTFDLSFKKDSIPDFNDPIPECPPLWNCDTSGQGGCVPLKKYTSKSFRIPGFPNCPLFASGSFRICTRFDSKRKPYQETQFNIDTVYFSFHNKAQCQDLKSYLDSLSERANRGEVWKDNGIGTSPTVIKDGKLANTVLTYVHRQIYETAFLEISKSVYRDKNKGSETSNECVENDTNCENCFNYFRNVQGFCMMTVIYSGKNDSDVVKIRVYPDMNGNPIKVGNGVIVPNPRKPDSVVHQSDLVISYYQCGNSC